jgi:hypothetical protein
MVKTSKGVKAQWSTESSKLVGSAVKSGTPLQLNPGYVVFLEGQFVTWLIERDLP